MSISNAPKLVRNVKDFDILKLYYFLIMKSCVHDSYICTGSLKSLNIFLMKMVIFLTFSMFLGALVKRGSPKNHCSFF